MEKIKILNFGSIKSEVFQIEQINVLIGPSASGKSIVAKLLFYFKNFPQIIISEALEGNSKTNIDKAFINKFEDYFPRDTWPKSSFQISYIYNETNITISKGTKGKLNLKYEGGILKLLSEARSAIKKYEREANKENRPISWVKLKQGLPRDLEKTAMNIMGNRANFDQLFIPAGRNFFSNLQSNIFTFLSSNKSIDPFLIQFGLIYESYKERINRRHSTTYHLEKISSINETIEQILGAKYLREKQKDYLIHNDKRKVNLLNASSGQQETLPLLILIKSISSTNFKFRGNTLYIEEPEAHLFPISQTKVIELLIQLFNLFPSRTQLIITTHSPYVLASFNTLMQAGQLGMSSDNGKLKKVSKIISKDKWIRSSIKAYSLNNGKKKNLIDAKTHLIKDNMLDGVSDIIASNFDKLLNLIIE